MKKTLTILEEDLNKAIEEGRVIEDVCVTCVVVQCIRRELNLPRVRGFYTYVDFLLNSVGEYWLHDGDIFVTNNRMLCKIAELFDARCYEDVISFLPYSFTMEVPENLPR